MIKNKSATEKIEKEIPMITIEMIRDRLTKEILANGITQKDLADKIGVKQPTISQYLSGRAMPALDTFAKICKVLDVSSDYILGLSEV